MLFRKTQITTGYYFLSTQNFLINNKIKIIMMRLTGCAAALMLALSTSSTNALAPNKSLNIERRNFFGIVGSAGAAALLGASGPANAAALKTGLASPFTGDFDDPNHPGCLRQVKVVGSPLRADGTRSAYPLIEVTGYDGKGEGSMCKDRPTRADLWKIQGAMKSNTEALIDFSPKGGPAKLLAKWEDGAIVFPDGNKWTKVAIGTNNRRPADMSTLKSE